MPPGPVRPCRRGVKCARAYLLTPDGGDGLGDKAPADFTPGLVLRAPCRRAAAQLPLLLRRVAEQPNGNADSGAPPAIWLRRTRGRARAHRRRQANRLAALARRCDGGGGRDGCDPEW
jgi:hypothetical protein